MSLLKQLQAAVADGTIKKGSGPSKPRKPKKPTNPNIAKKYVAYPKDRIRGERHGFAPPPRKDVKKYQDNRIIMHGKFILPVMSHYMIEEIEAAEYHHFDFIGCSPIWPQHLTIGAIQ